MFCRGGPLASLLTENRAHKKEHLRLILLCGTSIRVAVCVALDASMPLKTRGLRRATSCRPGLAAALPQWGQCLARSKHGFTLARPSGEIVSECSRPVLATWGKLRCRT